MIEFGWGDLEHTYLVISFKGKWTVEDFTRMLHGLKQIYSMNKSFAILIDLRYSHSPPLNIMGVMTRAMRDRPDNIERIIMVSRSKIWKRLYEAIVANRKQLALNIQFVNSMDSAYKRLLAPANGS